MRCLSGVVGQTVMIDAIRNDCEKEMHTGMEVIELEWCKEGNTYRSWAVAEKEGRLCLRYRLPYCRHGSMEQCDRDSDGIGKRKSIREVLHVEELVGDGTYSYRMYCRSSFGEDGILKSVQMHAKQSSVFGWHCSAEIYTEEGVIDQDAYHLCHWKNKSLLLGRCHG